MSRFRPGSITVYAAWALLPVDAEIVVVVCHRRRAHRSRLLQHPRRTLVLCRTLYKRPDFGDTWLLVLFGVFIFACGPTHIIKIWNIWNYAYWAEGYLTAFTGVVSTFVAIAVWPAIPKLLAIPSSARLEQALNELRDKHEALQNSETQYRLLIETASEGVRVISTDGRHVFFSPIARCARCSVASRSKGPVSRTSCSRKTRAMVHVKLEQRANNIAERYEFTFRRQDGSAIHTIVSGQVLKRDRSGNITSILGVITDITDRVLAEQKLEQLNRELEERVAQRTSTIAEVNDTLQTCCQDAGMVAEELCTQCAIASFHRSD